MTARVCMKNAVLLTFLTYWQLLPVKSLFLKGTLLWAEAWYIHWHGLQDSYHGEQPKAMQGSAVLQATCYCTPAPPSPDRDRSRAETRPRCKAGSPSQRWENQLVQGEAFHLTMVESGSWRNGALNFLIPSWSLTLGIAVFTNDKMPACLPSFYSQMKRGDTWMLLGDIKQQLHSPLTLCQLTWLSKQKGH